MSAAPVRCGWREDGLDAVPLRPPTLRDLDPLLAELRQRVPELQGIWLFGSLARGSVRADSDIDLALLACEPLDVVRVLDLGLDLGVIAGRDVDLVDLRRISVLLRHIVCADHVRRIREVDPGTEQVLRDDILRQESILSPLRLPA